jgi:hypothetical protein
MSIMDAKLIFSDCQTFASTDLTTQAASTNTIDLGAEDLAMGSGTPLYLNIQLAEDFVTNNLGTTGTITFKLDNDTGTNWADTGPSLIEKKVNIGTLTTIGAVAGNHQILRQALPTGPIKRYLRMLYVRGVDASTGFTSALHIDAWITAAVPETDVGT